MDIQTTNELQGRVALVTGGSGDIGSAIVRALARRGAHVAIHYHHNQEQAQRLSDEIGKLGVKAVVVGGDLTQEGEIERVAKESQSLGPIDILINNAGTPIRRVPWLELEAEFLDEIFNLNFRAPLYLTNR